MALLFLFFIMVKILCCAHGYPDGAPSGACEDMMPRHSGVQPQPLPVPYTILANTGRFQPGKPITVSITGPDYRGVLLEARTFGSTNTLGSWQFNPPDTKLLQCSGNPHAAVTHSNTNLKGNTTVYSWVPPDSARPIYFVATVAQQRAVFWVGVRSNTLTRDYGQDVTWMSRGASSGITEEKPLLLLMTCFFLIQVLK